MISIRIKSNDVAKDTLQMQLLDSSTVEELRQLIINKKYVDKSSPFGLKMSGKRKQVSR